MSTPPSLEQVITFVQEQAGPIPAGKVGEHTRLEADLGIYGLDADELLLAAQSRFRFRFPKDQGAIRQAFDLRPNEQMFSNEPHLLSRVFSALKLNRPARDLTVGELWRAIRRCMRPNNVPPNNSLEPSRDR